MTLDDAKNLAVFISAVVTASTLIKAVFEYARQNAQKRAEYYLKLREKYLQNDSFAEIFELLDCESEKLSEIPHRCKLSFLCFFEDVALLVSTGLMKPKIAYYMFGYYAIRCWDSEHFWKNYEYKDDPYWWFLKQFVKEMRRFESKLLMQKRVNRRYRL